MTKQLSIVEHTGQKLTNKAVKDFMNKNAVQKLVEKHIYDF